MPRLEIELLLFKFEVKVKPRSAYRHRGLSSSALKKREKRGREPKKPEAGTEERTFWLYYSSGCWLIRVITVTGTRALPELRPWLSRLVAQ